MAVHDLSEFRRKGPVGCGLVNLGNTCYMNSVLQGLVHSKVLTKSIRREPHRATCRRGEGNCVLCSLEALAQTSWRLGPHAHVTPYGISRQLPRIGAQFHVGSQEDSHEFLRYIIDALQKATLPPGTKLPPHPAVDASAPPMDRRPYPFRCFTGAVQSQVKCAACNAVSNKVDPIEDLELELGMAASVDEALLAFTKTEVLEGPNAYKCEKCGQRVRATKRMSLLDPPPILAIHLKRFTFAHMSAFGPVKVGRHIEFKERLGLTRHLTNKKMHGEDKCCIASLYGVVVHQGMTVHSGHYYSYVKGTDGQWYLMNDSHVSRVSWSTVSRDSAYILLYEVSWPDRNPPPAASKAPVTRGPRLVYGPPRPPATRDADDALLESKVSEPQRHFIGPALPPTVPPPAPPPMPPSPNQGSTVSSVAAVSTSRGPPHGPQRSEQKRQRHLLTRPAPPSDQGMGAGPSKVRKLLPHAELRRAASKAVNSAATATACRLSQAECALVSQTTAELSSILANGLLGQLGDHSSFTPPPFQVKDDVSQWLGKRLQETGLGSSWASATTQRVIAAAQAAEI
uniref:ubiquitinyl hydrolase 1 n=1 Tax=Rhizochromulina marina TaxID=1034831 RepID=A0A6U0XHQ1_9STRA|mmetsp:Transcript_13868/g.40624  ORF Transcript_13868/g.40624 Transcript_13868/m.40624 type:complete len:568 (+) Transcript_13868:185-1888(+)